MKLNRIGVSLASALCLATVTIAPSNAQTPSSAIAPAPPINAASRKAVIETVIARINANYVFPDRLPAITRALRQKLASGAFDTISNPNEFAEAVNKVIEAVAHDRHLRLSWSEGALPPMHVGEPDAALMAQQVAMMARKNFGIPKAEVLDGNVGYLKMDLFARAENAGPVLAAAMTFLRRTDAMIIDLRDNGGGDPGMVSMAVSYLVAPGTQINTFHRRDNPVDEQMWTMPYVPGGRWSTDKPVYVLTSKDTASGAEEFAYDLQQLKRGTVVGEITWGGANPGDFFPVDQHFAIFVPTGAAVNPISKTNWEGVGVKPDVSVDRAAALETARRMALQKLLANAKGERAQELQEVLQVIRPLRDAALHGTGR